MDFNDKSLEELKKKVMDMKLLYFSHLKGLQNTIHFHKENSNASMEKMKYVSSTNGN